MKFSHPFLIQWNDLDANLHVANTAYNVLATNARVAFLFSVGFKFDPSLTFGPVVLSDTIAYKRELHFEDKGTVELQLLGLSVDQARWKVRHIITKESGEIAALIESFGGWMDLTARKLIVPQADFISKFALLDRSEDFETLRPLRV